MTELQRAAAALDGCGAVRYRQRAGESLGSLATAPTGRTRRGTTDGAGIELLTQREREVARLVDHKTNPQIAAELFLSQKTVETHLSNIFNKLGIADRVSLARAIERADGIAEARSA